MGTSKRHPPKSKLLSSTRPKVPITAAAPLRLSSRTTRSLIRNHHKLQKRLSQAKAVNDASLATSLQEQIDAQGGLEKYQQASIQGQANDRGGDSSKVLMQWIQEAMEGTRAEASSRGSETGDVPHREASRPGAQKLDRATKQEKLKMLEVGALRVDNACARSNLFDMERIDLHSQHKDILEQDFMERPLPRRERLRYEGFDLVSLSLVVNYVGDPVERGNMLMRTRDLFRYVHWSSINNSDVGEFDNEDWRGNFFPGLFLVLPAPCVLNSRYLSEERLERMMGDLGFELLRKRLSSKLVYYYWRYLNPRIARKVKWPKEQIRSGKSRNNFAVSLA